MAELRYSCPGEADEYLTKDERKLVKIRTFNKNDIFLFDGCYKYVVSAKGSLYIDGAHQTPYHSGILAGKAVQSAGMLQIEKCSIVAINRASGHYQPSKMHHELTLLGLHRRGLIGPEVRIDTCYLDSPGTSPTTLHVRELMPLRGEIEREALAHERRRRLTEVACWGAVVMISVGLTALSRICSKGRDVAVDPWDYLPF